MPLPLAQWLRVSSKAIGLASSTQRHPLVPYPEVGMSFSQSVLAARSWVYRLINRFARWDRLPLPLALFNLPALRYDLRKHNLYDTTQLPTKDLPPPSPFQSTDFYARRVDGTQNDRRQPLMGCAGARFGRNVPLEYIHADPNPHETRPTPYDISRVLMTRRQFIPATSLNLLAAAWIQFQVHDWFNHEKSTDPNDLIDGLPLPHRLDVDENGGPNVADAPHTMFVQRTARDSTRLDDPPGQPPTFLNAETHWWDGSQLYGSSDQAHQRVRAYRDGKVRIEPDGLLPLDPDPELADPDTGLSGIDLTGFNDNWWVGLSLLHTVFVREHNAICDRLKTEYPTWGDERLFQTARLINAALMAKIHTVEWTPAILGHPALKIGMNANWWGLFGERIYKLVGRLSDSEEFSGIPGSPLDHHGVPYCFSEEFVTVYRMHPLIADDYRFHMLSDSEFSRYKTFMDIQGYKTRPVIQEIGIDNVLYSFGLAHPGAITLGNYPRALQHLTRIKKINGRTQVLDMAAVDIIKDRERGVPRYNAFRQFLRLPRVKTFEDLNPEWAKYLSDLYEGDIDRVDALVGMFAETPPKGFGFSDTAFRIFILMASRRLKSDRFYTTDYTPEVYTRVGMDWIDDNGMRSVLLRHYPTLAPALEGIGNPFAPWRNVHDPASV